MKELWNFVMNWINKESDLLNFANDMEHWAGFIVTNQAYNTIILIGAIIGIVLMITGIYSAILQKEILVFKGNEYDLLIIPIMAVFWLALWIATLLITWILFIAMYIWPLWIFIGILFLIKWWRSYERPIKQPKPIDETEKYKQELLSNLK